jgi:hypothetical protein
LLAKRNGEQGRLSRLHTRYREAVEGGKIQIFIQKALQLELEGEFKKGS